MNVLPHRPSLQSIAAKCTKVGNEQPSKQPLKVAQKVRQEAFWHGMYLNLIRACTEVRFEQGTATKQPSNSSGGCRLELK
jgi:hypothetical protein